ncbi:hypothetical protein GCM10010307_81790 [Streptomyces vastus]|uniref:Uncharacterized protein n=1 Tax=Streptomyces vastus TaxID=285451 RepID=A0ABP6EAC7_9ACTN
MQAGQVGGADLGDPVGELGVVALRLGQELRELAGETGEFGHLGAGFGKFPQECGVLVAQVLGAGEEEPGEALRGGHEPLALGAALGDVAVQQVEAAGVARLLDLPEQVLDGDGRAGGAAGAEVVAVGGDERGLVAGCAAVSFMRAYRLTVFRARSRRRAHSSRPTPWSSRSWTCRQRSRVVSSRTPPGWAGFPAVAQQAPWERTSARTLPHRLVPGATCR